MDDDKQIEPTTTKYDKNDLAKWKRYYQTGKITKPDGTIQYLYELVLTPSDKNNKYM